jgi:hypothetical protein
MGAPKLQYIRASYEEQTNGEFEDWAYCRLSFFPFGKAGGLQIRRCRGLAVG